MTTARPTPGEIAELEALVVLAQRTSCRTVGRGCHGLRQDSCDSARPRRSAQRPGFHCHPGTPLENGVSHASQAAQHAQRMPFVRQVVEGDGSGVKCHLAKNTNQGDIGMATFITTIKFTDRGEKNIQETTRRAASFKAIAKKMGVKVTDIFWTLGVFDGVLIFDAADDETATAALLHLGSLDNLHTSTVRAFRAAEMEKILAMLPKP